MQTITLKSDGTPAVIMTPLGPIKIHRIPSEPRKIQIELPEGLKAFTRMDRAVENSPFVEKGEDGQLKPGFQMLTPKTNENGDLVGVEMPTVFTLGDSK